MSWTEAYSKGCVVEFLVRMQVQLPDSLAPSKRAELYSAEADRARALAEAGVLRRLWRVPGRRANVGVWEAPDATGLHEAVSSLPLWPYMNVDVDPLAEHPNDPGG